MNGKSPLYHAVSGGYTETVKTLLYLGAIADEEDLDGKSPFHIAAGHGKIDIMKILAQKITTKYGQILQPADINKKDKDDRYLYFELETKVTINRILFHGICNLSMIF